MKTGKLELAMLIAAMVIGGSPFAGESGSNGNPHRGGEAPNHMSEKGQANTNAWWSADPERGWLRADERHELRGDCKPHPSSYQAGPTKKASDCQGIKGSGSSKKKAVISQEQDY